MRDGYLKIILSRLEHNERTGTRCLIVYYDSKLDDFNEAIEKALSKHCPKPGDMTVIVSPDSKAKYTDYGSTHTQKKL
jgi:hypothetical protein